MNVIISLYNIVEMVSLILVIMKLVILMILLRQDGELDYAMKIVNQ
jgi:hypothetical protein